MPEPNVFEQLKELEKRIIELAKKQDEEKEQKPEAFPKQALPLRPIFLSNIYGKFQTLKDTTSHSSRNFNEQLIIVSTNGKHYLGINFDDGWWYIKATNSVA